jgi:hypothetical protein
VDQARVQSDVRGTEDGHYSVNVQNMIYCRDATLFEESGKKEMPKGATENKVG